MKNTHRFELITVSDKRQKFLSEWQRERSLDLYFRQINTPDAGMTESELSDISGDISGLSPKNFDTFVQRGDIRLLSSSATTDPLKLAYMAVLDIYPAEGMALVAPFSPYSNPGTKGEWLTGFEAAPLRVLQLWNAQPMPILMLSRSWRCCSFSQQELSDAKALYRHTVAGTWPKGELRESIGLAVHSLSDPRVEYQDEELELYAPIRSAVYNLQTRVERPHRAKNKYWADPHFLQPALAADDGSLRAHVLVLDDAGGMVAALDAKRVAHIDPGVKDEPWQSRWRLESWQQAVPGLPVFAYPSKEASSEGVMPLAIGFTGGEDGSLVLFEGFNNQAFEQLDSPDVALVVEQL